MNKTFKSAVSIFLLAVFVLSLMPVMSFAESATHPGMRADGNSFALTETKTGWQRYEVVNDYIGGKGEEYALFGDSAGAPYRNIPVTAASGAKDVLEMSLYIPSNANGSSFEIAVHDTGTKYKTLPLLILNDGIYTNFSSGPKKIVSLEADKWNTLAIVSPEPYDDSAASNSNKVQFYVNGVLKLSQAVTYSAKGFRHLRFFSRGNGSLDPVMYVDNVRIFSGDYVPEYDVVDSIDYVGGIEGNSIVVEDGVSVAQLKEGITKKEDTTIRVYKSVGSTQPLADDEIVKEGYMVVAAAKNGADMERSYNYYTVKRYIHTYPGVNAGTTVLKPDKTSADIQRMESVTGNVGGKDEQYLLLADASGASSRAISLDNAGGAQDVFEMSVYIPEDSKGISLSLYFTNLEDKSVSLPLLIRKDGIYTNFSAGPNRFYTLEPNKWHNLAFVTPEPYVESDATHDNKIKIYHNGKLVNSRGVTATKSGFRNKIFIASAGDSTDEPQAYFDNIRVHSGEYAPKYDTLDVLGYTGEIIDNQIIMKGTMTVAQLKESITKKDDTTIRVYESLTSNRALSDNEIVRNGYTLVAAAKNGAEMERSYNYYTVGKYIYKYPGNNDGTTVLSNKSGTASSFGTMQSVKGNLGGKENDDYLVWCNSDGANQRVIPITDATGTQDVLEMSFYIPSDSNGFSIGQFLSNTANTGACGFSLWFKPSGLYTRWSSSESWQCALEPDKWHTFALVTPTPYVDGTEAGSDRVTVYLDGKKMEFNTNATKTGFRYLNLACFANGDMRPAVYFDNIRTHSNPYPPEYDALDDITFTGMECNNKVVTLKGLMNVAQLKECINKKEDTSIRVYENISSTTILSDDAIVENGYVVVAAAKNESEMERTYNYYTVNKLDYEASAKMLVNGADAKLYDNDDAVSVIGSFGNYTSDTSYNVTMYVAQYQYNELVGIWDASQTIASGETKTLSCDLSGMTNRENSKIKVLIVDEYNNPYTVPTAFRYDSKDTEATLYLLGDSIVQTYVNVGYPIQGWGYYIENYLNDNITVENRATSGWTTDHYLYPDGIYTKENGLYPVGTELLNSKGNKKTVGESNRYKVWSNILSELKAGDYVMVSLGINDSGSGNVPEERYLENITTIYEQATAKGATVIFSTPTISGKDWDNASFGESWGGRGVVCSDFAKSRGAVCIPLGAELVKTYNAMADEFLAENPTLARKDANNYVRNYFHMYPSKGTPPEGWSDFGTLESDDTTHHNVVGSNKVASIIAKLLLESGSPLGDYVIIPQ